MYLLLLLFSYLYMNPETIYKVLLTDDHQLFIDGVRLLLRKEKYLNIIAEAHNGLEALDMLGQHDIDLLITDIQMPEMDGLELTKAVKEKYPDVKVLVLSMFNDRQIINEIIMAEADGYVLKNAGKQELLMAIKKILDDATYYSNEVASILIKESESRAAAPRSLATAHRA